MLALGAIVVSIAALFGLVSTRWLRLPIMVGTMLLTVLLSVGLAGASRLVPGLHRAALHSLGQIHYETFILHGLLSLLLFAGAFLLDLEALAREKLTVGALAVLGTLLSTALVAFGMHLAALLLGLDVPGIQCLLFAALISPTDPIAVLEMLGRVSAPRYLQAQLAGESLFNDGVGAVLFLTALGIAESGTVPSAMHTSLVLLVEAGGALLLGVALAWPVARLMRSVSSYQIDILLTLSLALGGYALAEKMGVSAPLEAVAAGLALRWETSRDPSNIAHREIEHFWKAIDEVQNSILFVLMGLELLAVSFNREALSLGGAAVAVVIAARFIAVAAVLAGVRAAKPSVRSSLPVLAWGGLRGGLSIALALSVPEQLGRGWIMAVTYVVVVFSIVLAGGTMEQFLRRFNPPSLEEGAS